MASIKRFDYEDHSDYRVVDYTQWTKLDRFRENLEARSGVYLFADRRHKVKYVGMAGAGRMVEEVAHRIRTGKSAGATRVKGIYTNSEDRAHELEVKLINKYQPTNNSNHC